MPVRGQLSYWDCVHIREILSDPILVQVLLLDGERAKNIEVSMDGTITIGRTKYKWLNWMFKDTKTMSFTDFAFKVANKLAGQVKNRNNSLFLGISEYVLNNTFENETHDIHKVADALYDTFRHGWNSESGSTFMHSDLKKDLPEQSVRPIKRNRDYIVGELRTNSGELLIPRIEIEHHIR